MGNKRRIMRPNHGKKKIAMVDTKMAINGCQVLLAHPDPVKATQTARKFAEAFPAMMARSRVPNMQDFYKSHFEACEKMKLETDT
ncbi:hypothetical protein KAR91_50720 [Candidatus Pacearchaeota archaeon]|nr:hypothetical protein [Candidatus Pacearchaeota archaeon]